MINRDGRPSLTAKCIYVAIAILTLASIVVAVVAISREPAPIRGSAGPLAPTEAGPARGAVAPGSHQIQ